MARRHHRKVPRAHRGSPRPPPLATTGRARYGVPTARASADASTVTAARAAAVAEGGWSHAHHRVARQRLSQRRGASVRGATTERGRGGRQRHTAVCSGSVPNLIPTAHRTVRRRGVRPRAWGGSLCPRPRGPMRTTYGCGRVLARARADAHTGRGERREACTHRDPGRIPETAASGVSCAAEPTSADPVHTAATCHRANMRARRDQYLCV